MCNKTLLPDKGSRACNLYRNRRKGVFLRYCSKDLERFLPRLARSGIFRAVILILYHVLLIFEMEAIIGEHEKGTSGLFFCSCIKKIKGENAMTGKGSQGACFRGINL